MVSEAKIEHIESNGAKAIHERHVAAANMMADSVNSIRRNCAIDESIQDTLDDIDDLLDELEDY